jgi:hypothetical protein
MSQEVHLTEANYSTIQSWYRLAFGADKQKPKLEDEQTLGKIMIMQLGKKEELDEWKKIHKD